MAVLVVVVVVVVVVAAVVFAVAVAGVVRILSVVTCKVPGRKTDYPPPTLNVPKRTLSKNSASDASSRGVCRSSSRSLLPDTQEVLAMDQGPADYSSGLYLFCLVIWGLVMVVVRSSPAQHDPHHAQAPTRYCPLCCQPCLN